MRKQDGRAACFLKLQLLDSGIKPDFYQLECDRHRVEAVHDSESIAAFKLNLWLMSRRVLKRDMELAMLDVLVERTKKDTDTALRGRYIPAKITI